MTPHLGDIAHHALTARIQAWIRVWLGLAVRDARGLVSYFRTLLDDISVMAQTTSHTDQQRILHLNLFGCHQVGCTKFERVD